MKPLTFMISGHRDITQEEFNAYYKHHIGLALQIPESSFILGNAEGADKLAQEFLHETITKNNTHNKVNVCILKKRIPTSIPTSFTIETGFDSSEECDAYMTSCSDVDIAWIREGKEDSNTAKNLIRRQEFLSTQLLNIMNLKRLNYEFSLHSSPSIISKKNLFNRNESKKAISSTQKKEKLRFFGHPIFTGFYAAANGTCWMSWKKEQDGLWYNLGVPTIPLKLDTGFIKIFNPSNFSFMTFNKSISNFIAECFFEPVFDSDFIMKINEESNWNISNIKVFTSAKKERPLKIRKCFVLEKENT